MSSGPTQYTDCESRWRAANRGATTTIQPIVHRPKHPRHRLCATNTGRTQPASGYVNPKRLAKALHAVHPIITNGGNPQGPEPKTMNSSDDTILSHLKRSGDVIERAAGDRALIAAATAIADRIALTFRNGGKLLLAGNGGSAGDAQHIAAEFVGRFIEDRAALPAIALTTDTSALTAIANDYGFEHVFERQIRALGRSGDVFLAMSTSGRSPNIVAALKTARELGLVTVGFTKLGQSAMLEYCDLFLAVPSEETALTQQVHIAVAHAICGLVERALFSAGQ